MCYIYLIGVMLMRILGVDPGIATVGFAVLDAEKRSQRLLTCGVITTPAKTQLSSRLDQIYRDLNELIAQFHPEVMAVEELFFNTAAASFCSRAIRPGCRSMNTRRCRSSRRSLDTAARTKSRSWTWCAASCLCRRCRGRTTRRTLSPLRCAMRAAPHL